MSGPTDYGMRMSALDKAVSIAHIVGADAVVETAEKFLAFMTGADKAKTTDTRPVFILPNADDGYVYYRFWGLNVLYRADTSFGALAGGVARISFLHQTEWASKGYKDAKGTRHALNNDPDFCQITAEEAARLLRENVKGVRFE